MKVGLTLLYINSFNFFFSTAILNSIQSNKNKEAVSKVIIDIIAEYFVKPNIRFNIHIFRPISYPQQDIIDAILIHHNETYKTLLKVYTIPVRINHELKFVGSGIVFVYTIEGFEYIAKTYFFTLYLDEPIKFIFHIPDASLDTLKNTKLLYECRVLEFESCLLFLHSFFITDEGDFISLSTFQWFGSKCNHAELVQLNTFNEHTMMWTTELKYYEKYLDYNGCELVMGLARIGKDLNLNLTNIPFYWGYSELNNDSTDFSIHGITPVVFNIAAKKFNFKDEYWPIEIDKDWILEHEGLMVNCLRKGTKIVMKKPLVYFYVYGTNVAGLLPIRTANIFRETKFILLVTPAEAYTMYEKLFLPFDLETWILLTLTFLVTFFAILIINNLSKTVQNFLYGQNIKTPLLNVFSIFFGIAQARLPAESFSRFIMMLFILFCLIFRTCYQGLLFKFMRSEPRRPPPQSLNDLIANNYKIYSLYADKFEYIVREDKDNW